MSNLYYPAGTIIHSKSTNKMFIVTVREVKHMCRHCAVGILARKPHESCTNIIQTVLGIPITRGACNGLIPSNCIFKEITGGL